MFSVSAISSGGYNHFSNGAMYGGKVNGAQVKVMQSQEYTDQLIKEFEEAIAAGYDPNEVTSEVFEKVGCTSADLTDFDRQRLRATVENIYNLR